jgi:hypothetical protein
MEKRDSRRLAAIPQRSNPIRVTRSIANSAFATRDHPVQSVEVELIYRTKEWLSADEPHGGRHQFQLLGSPRIPIVLN